MKKGDEVQVRLLPMANSGAGSQPWTTAQVEITSKNDNSLCVSAPSGLASPEGVGIDRTTGRMLLLLLRRENADPRFYQEIVTGFWWEVLSEEGLEAYRHD